MPTLTLIAEALGTLCDELVFVGGCAAGLLLTDVQATGIRPTDDVDAVAEAATLSRFYAIEAELPKRGFVRDAESGVICRWKHRDSRITFDLMPTDPQVLGFANRWYPEAVRTASTERLAERLNIRLISAPVFVATKLEAFITRGKRDLYSHDLEDILIVVDGRPALPQELRQVSAELRLFVAAELTTLLRQPDFENVLPGLIADGQRTDIVLARLREMTA
nr:hypothetical protein [Sinimarinibacterium flocculans]